MIGIGIVVLLCRYLRDTKRKFQPVAKSLANGLVGTWFASRYRRQSQTGFLKAHNGNVCP